MARRRRPSLPVLQIALAAVMEGGTPDVSDDDTLGTVQIRDPWDPHDAPPRTKVVNLRCDPLGRLWVRKQILECHYAAGRQWQRDFHDAELANLKAFDFSRDVVDGGRGPEILTDRQLKAMAAIARYDRALGRKDAALVRQVLGNRMFMEEVAATRGESSQRALDYYARRLKDCLDTLAEEMGLATRRR